MYARLRTALHSPLWAGRSGAAALAARAPALMRSSARHHMPVVVAGFSSDSATTPPPPSGIHDLVSNQIDHPPAPRSALPTLCNRSGPPVACASAVAAEVAEDSHRGSALAERIGATAGCSPQASGRSRRVQPVGLDRPGVGRSGTVAADVRVAGEPASAGAGRPECGGAGGHDPGGRTPDGGTSRGELVSGARPGRTQEPAGGASTEGGRDHSAGSARSRIVDAGRRGREARGAGAGPEQRPTEGGGVGRELGEPAGMTREAGRRMEGQAVVSWCRGRAQEGRRSRRAELARKAAATTRRGLRAAGLWMQGGGGERRAGQEPARSSGQLKADAWGGSWPEAAAKWRWRRMAELARSRGLLEAKARAGGAAGRPGRSRHGGEGQRAD
nr:spidroin-1-like [Aegilops tauschii subsp. strangulata]